jgi:hypothetical protein
MPTIHQNSFEPLNPLGPLLHNNHKKRTVNGKYENIMKFLGLKSHENGRLHLIPSSKSATIAKTLEAKSYYRNIGDSISVLLHKLRKGDNAIVDESELIWDGENWLNESLLSHTDELESLAREKGIFIWIKIDPSRFFGYRDIGAIILISPLNDIEYPKKDLPSTWSCNYIERVFGHSQYMSSSWALVSDLHRDSELQLEDLIESTVHSLPWIEFKKQRHSLIIKILEKTGAEYTIINGKIRMALTMNTDAIIELILRSINS